MSRDVAHYILSTCYKHVLKAIEDPYSFHYQMFNITVGSSHIIKLNVEDGIHLEFFIGVPP